VEDDTRSAESIYQSIVSAHEAAAKATIPIKRKTKKQPPREKKDVVLRRSVVKQNHVTYIDKTTRKNKISLNKALDDLKDASDKNKKEYIGLQNKISEIETAHIQKKSKLAWATIREVSNYKMSHTGRPPGNNPTERIKLWKNTSKTFFANQHLYQNTPNKWKPAFLN